MQASRSRQNHQEVLRAVHPLGGLRLQSGDSRVRSNLCSHVQLLPEIAVISNWGVLRIGQTVKIFMGAGWLKGTVRTKFKDSVVIQLDRRTARCYDLRNIQI
jgi:sRNA-binding protein